MAKTAKMKTKTASKKKDLSNQTKNLVEKKTPTKVSKTKSTSTRSEAVATTSVKRIAAKEEVKKIAVKKAPEKLTTKEPLKRVTTKTVDKIAMKPELKKVTMKEEPKKIIKKAAVKKKTEPKVNEKKAYYDAMSLEDCIHNMQLMNVQYHYEDYAQLLSDEADIKQLITNIQEGNHLHELNLDYKVDGYDIDLVKVTLEKVKASMDVTPADFKSLKKEIETSMTFVMGQDEAKNAEEYLKEFHLCERLMLLGKRKHMEQMEDMNTLLKVNIADFTKHFMDLAYAILGTWKYEDVTFYEDFMYAYVSSFPELYFMFEQRVQLDCADLYILHGDQQRGHAGYDYLLRDNQIKDYIYYRFAHVYEDFNLDMAKSIAQSSLEWVDDRFDYHHKIIEILQK